MSPAYADQDIMCPTAYVGSAECTEATQSIRVYI